MDMKLTYWVFPTEMPAVGMIPVSFGAHLMLLMICLEMPTLHTGEPEYLSDGTPSGTGSVAQIVVLAAEQRVVSPLVAVDAAVAECVAEGHQHLVVGGIAVVPHDPEVGPGDGERLRVLLGPSGPVTQSTSDVGEPPTGRAPSPGGGGGGAGAGWGTGAALGSTGAAAGGLAAGCAADWVRAAVPRLAAVIGAARRAPGVAWPTQRADPLGSGARSFGATRPAPSR